MASQPHDSQYLKSRNTVHQRPHEYGKGIYLVDDSYLLTLSLQLSDPNTMQPRFNEIVAEMYQALFQIVANHCLERQLISCPTRMATLHPRGVFSGEVITPDQKLVLVDLARAGMIPAMQGLNFFSKLLRPENVRVDHIFISREVDVMEKTVVGASIAGTKIGGAVDDAVLLVPDPMGATGTSVLNTLDLYERHVTGKPKRRIIIHLIAAPESLQRIRARYADVEIFTVRLDRGLSSEKVLAALPGTYWQDEKGLNEHQYIVPGAGGVGELMNNSFV